MNLYPDIYLKNVKEITIELLRKHEIKGLILDIDNTLIDYDTSNQVKKDLKKSRNFYN